MKASADRPCYWFDFEIDPCVVFFTPIVRRLWLSGCDVRITYRDYSSVPSLLHRNGLSGTPIGRHGGRRRLPKCWAQMERALLLIQWARRRKIDLGVGFTSRPLALACACLRIPNATVLDYEHVSLTVLRWCCNWLFVPQVVGEASLRSRRVTLSKVIRYPGLKEDVYVPLSKPRPLPPSVLAMHGSRVVVTVRPPATLAHYHEASSEQVCHALLRRIAQTPSVHCVLLRRADDSTFDEHLVNLNIVALPHLVDGLDLIAASDMVFCGGGTMAREAAAMGIPSFSFFAGTLGAVDDSLVKSGRLTRIRSVEDVRSLQFEKRSAGRSLEAGQSTVDFFVQRLKRLAADEQDTCDRRTSPCTATTHSHGRE